MRKIFIVSALSGFFTFGSFSFGHAQSIVDRDAEIAAMVKEVNTDSLQADVRALVSFGTRSTVSSTTDRKRGIGAAREWVLSRFNAFAAVPSCFKSS